VRSRAFWCWGLRALQVTLLVCIAAVSLSAASGQPISPTNIFAPDSTPAHAIYRLSTFVVEIEGVIFVVVFSLIAYAVTKFRQRRHDDNEEPPQVYGSNQVELAWTVVPVLIVVVLFVTTAQVIHRVQDARAPAGAINVMVVAHQFWWEYRYTDYGFVTANELHVPVSDPKNPTPTYLALQSADVDHSFWVPRLAGKTDLIPNHPNTTWIDPQETGLYLGQCSQYCGTQHAMMLLRVYVDSRDDFDRWVHNQQQQQAATDPSVAAGRALFVAKGCFACHSIQGVMSIGRIGPDLTHLASRDTLGSGEVPITPENLRRWVHDPAAFKPGSLMPAQDLSDDELNQISAFLLSLH